MKMSTTRTDIAIIAALILLTAAVFGQVVGFEFTNLDDNVYVTDNPHVKAGLTLEGVKWAFTTNRHGHWHPLTWLSHMTDVELFGLNPAGHHLTSLLLHTACTVLLFVLFRGMTGAVWRSAGAAALFAVHPLHVETVAWVADRKDALCGFFVILTLLSYVRYARRRRPQAYTLSLLFFALALLSKSMAVTLPAMLLLLDFWPLRRMPVGHGGGGAAEETLRGPVGWGRILWEKSGFLALAGMSAGAAWFAMRNLPIQSRPLKPYWATDAAVNYVYYLGKFLWPVRLSISDTFTDVVNPWQVGGAVAVLIAVTVAALLWVRRRPYLLTGWLWYLVGLCLVIGFLEGGPHRVADRYTYLPLIGLGIMAVWGVPDVQKGWRFVQTGSAIAAGAAVLGLALASWAQCARWKTSVTILEHSLKLMPQNYFAHNNLGDALARRGYLEGAAFHFAESVRLNPAYAMAHNNLGNVRVRQGRFDEAEGRFLQAIRAWPDFAEARINLGALYQRKGQHDRAMVQLSEAIRLDPRSAHAHYNLGVLLEATGRPDDAIAAYGRTLELDSFHADAHNNLGAVLAGKAQWREAIRHFEEAVALAPDMPEARSNLRKALILERSLK